MPFLKNALHQVNRHSHARMQSVWPPRSGRRMFGRGDHPYLCSTHLFPACHSLPAPSPRTGRPSWRTSCCRCCAATSTSRARRRSSPATAASCSGTSASPARRPQPASTKRSPGAQTVCSRCRVLLGGMRGTSVWRQTNQVTVPEGRCCCAHWAISRRLAIVAMATVPAPHTLPPPLLPALMFPRQIFGEFLDEYNCNASSPLNLVFFPDCCLHLCQPGYQARVA